MGREIESIQKAGIIVKSQSPWSSPVVPVRKPDGSLHLYIDYRSVTKPDPWYMPSLEEAVSAVGNSRVVSKLDLTKGYYQVVVAQADREKMAFIRQLRICLNTLWIA